MCHGACRGIRNLTGHPSLAVDHSQLVNQRPMSSNFCGARRTGEESLLAVAWSTLAASDSWSGVSFLWRFFVLCATVDLRLRTRGECGGRFLFLRRLLAFVKVGQFLGVWCIWGSDREIENERRSWGSFFRSGSLDFYFELSS